MTTIVAVDLFNNRLHELKSPLSDGFSVAPDDNNDLPYVTRAISVGGAGTVVVDLLNNYQGHNVAPVTLTLQPGLYWLRVKRVHAASTATGIVGLFC